MSDRTRQPPRRLSWIADLLGVGGIAALAIGAALIYTPLAWIVVGLCALSAGVLLGRRS